MENVTFGLKTGGGNGRGSWGDYRFGRLTMSTLDQFPRVIISLRSNYRLFHLWVENVTVWLKTGSGGRGSLQGPYFFWAEPELDSFLK